jgi:hypothetical protein
MPNRALIVAIEQYDRMTANDLAPVLPGTLGAGVQFREWLLTKGLTTNENIRFCTSPGCDLATNGATRPEILRALSELVEAGRDSTSLFFVYYSGHGFMRTDRANEPPTSVLACQDFESLGLSGAACLDLDEVARKVSLWMGGGRHFYFIDACRTELTSDQVEVTSMGLTPGNSGRAQSTPHLLYSAEPGRVAAVTSEFAPALLEGLAGQGHAKRWDGRRLFVTFASLLRFLQKERRRPVAPDHETAPGTQILEIVPIPRSRCAVEVLGATERDRFELEVWNSRGQQLGASRAFTGPTYEFEEPPEEYDIRVFEGGMALRRETPPGGELVDLYNPAVVQFHKPAVVFLAFEPTPLDPAPPDDGGPLGGPVELTVIGVPDTQLRISNVDTGEEFPAAGERFSGAVPPGRYRLLVMENGRAVRQRDITVSPQAPLEVDLGGIRSSKVRRGLLNALPAWARTDRTVQFSETLGNIASDDLSLWLSIVAASRVLGPDTFSKLKQLPLKRFDELPRDGSVFYILGGLEESEALQVGLSPLKPLAVPEWRPASHVQEMPGVVECRINAGPGPYLVTFALPDKAPVTMVTHALPNRATVLTVAEEGTAGVAIRQLMLPVAHLVPCLHPDVQQRLSWNLIQPLQAVRFIVQSQALFARGEDPTPPPESKDAALWAQQLYGKWLDPMMALLAGYRLLRSEERGGWEPVVVENLRKYFAGLPDTEVIARLAGLPHQAVRGNPPLVLDGLLTLGDDVGELPLPAHRLDYRSPWTAWLGAVAPPPPGGFEYRTWVIIRPESVTVPVQREERARTMQMGA